MVAVPLTLLVELESVVFDGDIFVTEEAVVVGEAPAAVALL